MSEAEQPQDQDRNQQPLSNQNINRLVDLLLACPSMQDPETRKAVLEMLPSQISNAIRHHAQNRVHVLNIIRTCQNYSGGLEALIDGVRFFDGGQFCMQEIEDFWKNSR
jgi:hypothetical protein